MEQHYDAAVAMYSSGGRGVKLSVVLVRVSVAHRLRRRDYLPLQVVRDPPQAVIECI